MIGLIARREWLEQRRQPGMMAVTGSLFVVIAAFIVGAAHTLSTLVGNAESLELVLGKLGDPEAQLQSWAELLIGLHTFLMPSQYLGMVAVMAGHTLIHDKQCGTTTFLLLAPVRRRDLLLGKVLGSAVWPTIAYLTITIPSGLALVLAPLTDGHSGLANTLGWWLVMVACAPAWALAVAGLVVVGSSFASDVRSAQQGAWFIVFFASLSIGAILTAALDGGLGLQLVLAALPMGILGAVVAVGAALSESDLAR